MAPPHAAQTMPLPTPRPPPPLVVPTNSSAQTVRMPISLLPANNKSKRSSTNKFLGKFRSIFRSFPIIVPSCKMATLNGNRASETIIHGGTRITGTLFGYRKARVNLAFQEDSKCHPFLLLELAIHTGKLLQDMGMGLNRLALECEKHSNNDKTKIIDEPIWTLFCNGKKTGYGVKRDPTDDDLNVMQMLHAVSVAVGVLPKEMSDPQDGELSYMRAHFERVIGSKDSETYYMMMPDGNNNGPELSVFFVRV
ncbi:protein MIZU-KUSSEI 1-like [Trifolium pratense]|uniref:protein MIZU-KUSSEI 1-like n=1 Tax=Trifolium pratense TaxID=57577 RepID=UPI001E6953B3|nr:protein MIZU-KUSSEI 1-like [Trifolium pratense]